MTARLTSHRYGKHRVRVSKVRRPREASAKDETHEFVEVDANVTLEGNFEAAYLNADNQSVIATDTCKNTVYALARDDDLRTIESFGLAIARHFVSEHPQVSACEASLSEQVWQRLLDSPHAFTADQRMTPTTTVKVGKDGSVVVCSGFERLLVAKTTESGFSDFARSDMRTLADMDDRILCTEISANWRYDTLPDDFAAARAAMVDALLHRFVDHYSHSVQETLYLMGQAAIDACSAAAEITLTLPNKHHLLVDLSPFDRDNANEVFVVTDQPYGYITATLSR